MTKPRLRKLAHWLAVLALTFQALIPLGQAVTLPGSAQPLVICSAFGLKTIYVEGGFGDLPPLPDEPAPAKAKETCVVCLSLAAAALQPPGESTLALPAVRAGATPVLPVAFSPPAMPLLMGIFARPPPQRA